MSNCRAVTAPATWSQRGLWDATEWMGDDDGYFNMGWIVPVPEGADLDRVARALRRTIERYDTLRTTFAFHDGQLYQHVAASGSLVVAVHESAPERVSLAADEILAALVPGGFRARLDWPLRVAVVTAEGKPRLLVLAINHLSLDLYGWRVVERTLTCLLADATAELPPRRGWQPVDQAAYEASPAGQAINQRALSRWRDILASAPATMFDFDTNPGEREPYWTLRMESRALAAALVAVADRTRISSSAALLAAISTALVAYTGHDEVIIRLNAANRLVEGSQEMAGYLCWNSLFYCDLRDLSFDAALRRTFLASLDAYEHGLHDPVRARAIWNEAGDRHGAHLDLGCHFNDRREHTGEAFAALSTSKAELGALLEKTRIWFSGSHPRVDTRFHVHAMDDDPESVELEFMCDTRYVPVDAMREILLAIERLLVTAADRDVAAEDIPAVLALRPAPRRAGWVRCRGGWVRPAVARRIWASLVGPDGMVFAVRADGGEHHLVAYYAAARGARGPRSLHRAFVAALGDRSDARAPDGYVCCAGAPPDIHDQAAWERMPEVERGSGRPE